MQKGYNPEACFNMLLQVLIPYFIQDKLLAHY